MEGEPQELEGEIHAFDGAWHGACLMEALRLDAALVCFRCGKHPSEIPTYVMCGQEEGITAAEYVRREEGTLNPENGHFACDDCYIAIGQPAARFPDRWRAP